MINKLIIGSLMVALSMGVTSCYSDFDEPAPAKVWTAADFESEGCQLISIKELKDMCANVPLAGYKEITEDYVIQGKVTLVNGEEEYDVRVIRQVMYISQFIFTMVLLVLN